MYIYYNPNPCGKSVGDCVIRALTKALDSSWDLIYLGLTIQGFIDCNWGSSNAVWGAYLKNHGFAKYLMPEDCPECYTVSDFASENQNGVYVLGTGEHVVTVVDGDYYDSWDSGRESVIYYFTKRR